MDQDQGVIGGHNIDGTFLISNNSVKDEPMALTLIKPIPYLLSDVSDNINHLQPSSKYQIINNNKSRIFRSNDDVLHQKVTGSMLVKLTVHSKDQYGVVSKLDAHNHFIINYLNTPMNAKSQESFQPLPYTPNIITQWSSTLSETKQNSFKLSMTPPIDNKSPIKNTALNEEGETIDDPFDYFLDRYFENLYLLTTPLTFFTKSTFTRLKTLCEGDNNEYESILKQFVIDHETFDNRHVMSNNGLLNSTLLYEKENIYRKKFIQKSLNLIDFDIHSSTSVETNKSLSNVLNNFKIRELHLQILLLIELIYVTDHDNVKHFKKLSKKPHLTKKSLVGRRKLTPTINGGAVPLEEQSVNKQVLNYNQILDIYIDKLCIWDVLMGTSSTDNSTPKFMSYIIVPYFNKKCPNSVKHMLKKIKGPSFKTSSSSSSKTNEKSSKSSSSSASLKRSASISSSNAEIKRPSLSRSSSNIKLEDIQELKTSLSRSNSDLQSLKRTSSFTANNLSKRQIDMSLPPIPSEPESQPLKRNSSIFTRVGKKLTQSITNNPTSSKSLSAPPIETFSQVDATPVKSVKYINPLLDQTPRDGENKVVTSSSPIEYAKTPQIMKTPAVIRSSVKKPGEPVDFNNAEEVEQMLGSPMGKGVRRRLFAPPTSQTK
ncbi:hypothetical protein WICANDRAFT_78386 [Wickerhamomyces anomalus NRRL Y-366-8]|uniref:DNA replication regulator Sld3 C-terminal domain-containing protein n=1 Tax=Wickerhamomyces anomalus (strain ATCC 58044 / CBS 1984 / NCYC 433 / NRRL Y-366-8) TaxID=683960 RepID=A0A1E3P2N3_WICAA|nr:uncharacterized protein WICANDRAFT_78386 [Wickerhamomyces anomalus NRRL Y-366-8]ODQ59749.1 hypothetical protein WICANDRAFT_78386 [Wickerhamomyces anomalus NRRL Y-366-8]